MSGRLIDARPEAERYDVDENGCWVWAGARLVAGYGRTGSHEYAHRYMYRLHKGDIPEGFDIDHLCMNKPCVNPEHLEAVTHVENVLRFHASRAKEGFCRHGHPLVEGNLMPRGKCRECNRLRINRYRAKKRLEVAS